MNRYWKELRNFIIHLRLPFQMPMLIIFLTGFILGGYSNFFNFIIGAIIIFVLISGGTVAYNSYYDNDEGQINFVKNPPKPTKSLLILSIIFKLSGIIFSIFINLEFFTICIVCVLMSVLYSHPKFKLKTKHGLDLIINGLGYGSLTVLGGWLCSTTEINSKIILFSVIAFFIVIAGHPITQIFQYKEDVKKEGKTFVAIFGPKTSLLISIIFLIVTLILSNIFLILYYSFFSSIVMSILILMAIGILYFWYKNFDIAKNIKIMGNRTTPFFAYSNMVMGFIVFIILILIG